MKSPKSHRLAAVISTVLATVLIVLAGVLWLNRQYVRDFLVVQQYTPTSSITAIANRSTMTDKATFLFYASLPEIDEASTFNVHCARQEESSAILGCYAGQRIYIYNVDDSRLDGIQEVTASHEMLHAAWDRLRDSEKKRLGALLEAAYSNVKTAELEARMAYYERTQPGERANELHSILGTEITDLGEDLEEYYSQYFTNRSTVVEFHAKYQTVFTAIKDQSVALASELDALASQINNRVDEYNRNIESLNEAIQNLNSRASSVDRTNSAAVNMFNSERNQLLTRTDELDATRNAINTDIASYNTKLEEYNQLALQAQELTKSIDSTLAPSVNL